MTSASTTSDAHTRSYASSVGRNDVERHPERARVLGADEVGDLVEGLASHERRHLLVLGAEQLALVVDGDRVLQDELVARAALDLGG